MAEPGDLRDIRDWLIELDAEVRDGGGATPTLSFRSGSALVLVAAFGGEDESPALIRLSACVVRNVRANEKPDLLAYLLRENDRQMFCTFAIDEAGDIWLNATLFADGLDKHRFAFLVTEMATLADSCDDRIVGTWGGDRFIDG